MLPLLLPTISLSLSLSLSPTPNTTHKMLSLTSLAALLTLSSLTVAHNHDDHPSPSSQEPFVGWTKEDLDAKWGTDVHTYTVELAR